MSIGQGAGSMSGPRASWTRSLALTLLLAAAPLPAQTTAPPVAGGSETGDAGAAELPVREVRFEGLRTLAEETLRYYLGLEQVEGTILDVEALDRAVATLWSRALVDDIRIETEPVDDGVRLIVSVTERPVLRSIEYEGLKRVTRSEIGERIDKERINAREDLPLSRGELQRLSTAITELYKEKGYRFAEVRYSLTETAPGEVKALFAVDEGDKVKIGKISFDGNDVYGDWRLRWTMKKTKETNLITRISKKDIYNPASIEEDLDAIRGLYRERGYKNVFVGQPGLEVRAKRPDAPTPKEQKRRLRLTVPIEEGDRWRFGEVSIEGNSVYSDEQLLRFFSRPRGGWLRASTIDESVEKVRDVYKANGYILAQVNAELRERLGEEEPTADLILRITEGDQFTVGRLEFQGNTRTRDRVLRREMRVQEGLTLNMKALQDSLYKIKQLNFFDLNEEDPIIFEPDYEKKVVNLTLQGTEADRTELEVGGGWSEVDGFFGQFALRTRNFLGRGESVGISVQTGRYRDLFDLSYFVPWFLDRPQSIGAQIFQRDLDYDLLTDQRYIQKSQGGVLSYGRNFRLFSSFSVAYTRQDIEDRRSFTQEDGSVITQDFTRDVSSLRPSFVYDSRDNRLQPTVGRRLSLSVEYAGGLLGGTSSFYRPEVGFSWFKPLTFEPVRTLFAINAEAGWVEPFDNNVLSFNETYFLGGDNSIRGFRFRSIWVRCEGGEIIRAPTTENPNATRPCLPDETLPDQFGFPQGGNKYFQLNLEYQFLFGEPFRLIFFGDAGNVYGEDQSVDLGRLRYSAGAEFRVFVPVLGAPLRFIYAFNLEPLPDDRFESFDFSIGTSF
jgi:outer membrane protein insertion porin family